MIILPITYSTRELFSCQTTRLTFLYSVPAAFIVTALSL